MVLKYYLHGCVSLLAFACPAYLCVCVCVCIISNQSASKKPHVSDLSKLDAMLHTQQFPSRTTSGTKVPRFDIRRSIIISCTSKVVRSPIQPKKQDNKKSSGGGGWMRQGRGRGVDKI